MVERKGRNVFCVLRDLVFFVSIQEHIVADSMFKASAALLFLLALVFSERSSVSRVCDMAVIAFLL